MYEVATKKSILKPITFEKRKSATNPQNNAAELPNFSGIAKTQYEKIKNPKFNSQNNLAVIEYRESSIQNPKIMVERTIK